MKIIDADNADKVADKFINDDAFSTTPLPAMEEALKAMMKFPDFENVRKFVQ